MKPLGAAWSVALFIAAGTPALTAAAQPMQVVAHGLTLEDALRLALVDAPAMRAAAADLSAAQGRLLAAGTLFDAHLRGQLANGLDRSYQPTGVDNSVFPLASATAGYGVGLDKTLRSGVVMSQSVAVTRTNAIAGTAVPTNGAASVNFQLLVPLSRDRGGRVSTAPERFAAEGMTASELDLRATLSSLMHATAVAYWSYAASVERMRVLSAAEARAERMVHETEVLVAADERTPADLARLRAVRASRIVARMNGEQSVAAAATELAVQIGLQPAALRGVGSPSTALPTPGAAATLIDTGSLMSARPDIAAAVTRARAAREAILGAADALRPRADLSLVVGYRGLQLGGSTAGLVQPLYRNVPGASTSLQLSYDFPVTNAGLRGELAQARAASDRAAIDRDDVIRRATLGARQAAVSLQLSLSALAQADTAADLSLRSVDAEQRKLRLGASTILDVIQAEEQLTNAQLDQAAQHLACATALADVRYESGTLVPAGAIDSRLAAQVARLLSVIE